MRGHTDRAEAEMAVHVAALTAPVGELIEAVLRKHHRAVLEAVKELHERCTKSDRERDAALAMLDATCSPESFNDLVRQRTELIAERDALKRHLERSQTAEADCARLVNERDAARDSLARLQQVWAENAPAVRYKKERDAAREALATRTKQLGVACMKHDLTHALACGHCYAEAREALRPFAKLADHCDRWNHPDESSCTHRICAADLRRARAILEAKP